ncbi:probable histone-lysine N-methyltransferase set-23 [Helicoverpa zea]|uniref:probable histone-lysine N-methyltransferase set-23 n=1 Tax=Helicoverpa zea TaxID=7113 RepID=UPI001F565981|nr:probable histone-lysine N-methyltransferase set-23 [Helicoverpa zea]XP_047039039.1 probable histone-lysine N-methyltransferase set-23 [Helicoverpa zea]
MNDNYVHVDNNVFYVSENIIGPCDQSADYKLLDNEFNSVYEEHCHCKEICVQATCLCLQRSCGDNYLICETDGQLKNKVKSYPIFECSDSCSCSTDCGNRVVQKGPLEGLDIRRCEKGFGLFATSFIPSGTFICEYAGEVITPSQASVRHHNNKLQGKMNYIFYLRELSGHHPIVTIIDPSTFGNIGRYINHSCEPNCHIVPVRCGSPIPKLSIFACADISLNEEITFHYGLNDDNNPAAKSDRISCLCRSKNCCGFMPFHIY